MHETVLPEETNHQKLVYIRWLKTSDTSVGGDSSLGTTGSNRIDNIVVYGLPRKYQEVKEGVPDETNGANESSKQVEEEPHADELASDQEEKAAPEKDEHVSERQPDSEEMEHETTAPEDSQTKSDVDENNPRFEFNPLMAEDRAPVSGRNRIEPELEELRAHTDELASDQKEKAAPEKDEYVSERPPHSEEMEYETTVQKHSIIKNNTISLNSVILFGLLCLIGGVLLLVWRRNMRTKKRDPQRKTS